MVYLYGSKELMILCEVNIGYWALPSSIKTRKRFLVDILTTNQRVGGSSPSWVTILKYDKASIRWVEVFFVAKILAYHIVIVLLLIGDCNKGRLI